MSWVQATLLARGLCRAWGGTCGATLTGTSISQVSNSQAVFWVEGGKLGICSQLLQNPLCEASSGESGLAYQCRGPIKSP